MALFTTADRDAVKTAMVRLATDGIATVTVGGQTVTVKSIDELRKLLDLINSDLASDQSHFGLRMITLVPPGAG
jgi:lipopolysaccharide/colanic/teichoic acid biosynthesis glycosyltransferase